MSLSGKLWNERNQFFLIDQSWGEGSLGPGTSCPPPPDRTLDRLEASPATGDGERSGGRTGQGVCVGTAGSLQASQQGPHLSGPQSPHLVQKDHGLDGCSGLVPMSA